MTQQLFNTLQSRGLISQSTSPQVAAKISRGELVCYMGVDPTAPSLHVGHLVPLMLLGWLARQGNRVIIVVGDSTASIGDPSGREETRAMLNIERITHNSKCITAQLQQLSAALHLTPTIVYNSEWLSPLRYIEFLREIGHYFSVNRMLSFESYRRRMERGLSFIEFNYQLLQSYDFLQLYQRYNCQLQIGGDDQWGNIVAGIDLIRRVENRECYGVTTPLVTNSQGEKMGKSLGGTVSLSADSTSAYDFYQYWRNIDDKDVRMTFMRYTMLPESQYGNPRTASEINALKETIATEITTRIHGQETAQQCRAQARALFGAAASADVPGSTLPRHDITSGIEVIDLCMHTPFFHTRSEARRAIVQGGVQINGQQVTNPVMAVTQDDIFDNTLLIKVGKKRHWAITFK